MYNSNSGDKTETIFSQEDYYTGGQARERNDTLKKNLLSGNNQPDNILPMDEHQHKSTRDAERRMHQLVRKSSQILFATKTVFPFDFFPDTITINANKIDIVTSTFFFSNQTTSIPLRDIANVEVQTSLLFAAIRIINIRYPMHPLVLHYLPKYDAMKAKNIIDGLIVSMSEGADVAAIEPKKLQAEIEKVGESPLAE